MKINKLLFGIFFIFLLSNVSSLQVLNSTISVEKTFGADLPFEFYIKNNEGHSFFNVSPEINSIFRMDVIPELQSTQIAKVTGILIGNTTGNYSIRIKGVYVSNLGIQNITHDVNIYYDEGVQPCQISVVKGDTINFKNFAEREVKIINKDTSVEIGNLPIGGSQLMPFPDSVILNYYVTWFGFQFSDICKITVLSDTGYINNPNKDGIININLNQNYPVTSIGTTFLLNEYQMDFYNTQDGIFLIKNTGTKEAVNIFFSGEWFVFPLNNLSLNPGDSRTISYTINPTVFYTNETNQTHIKKMSIIGNFPKVEKEFSIFINYANIDSGNFTQSDNLLGVIEKFCRENPEVCSGTPKVIYRDTNDTEVNVTLATSQLKQIFEYLYQNQEDFKIFQMYVKENLFDLNSTMGNLSGQQAVVTEDIADLKQSSTTSNSFILFIIIAMNGLIVIGGGVYLVYYYMREKKLEALRRT